MKIGRTWPMSEKTTSALMTSDIAAFHVKFSLDYGGGPRDLDNELGLFRVGFMIEELAEYARSSGFVYIARALDDMHEHIKERNRWLTRRDDRAMNRENQLDSLIDLVYVALGTSHMQGFDFDEGWRRVHEANMQKIKVERIEDSKRSSKYDVVKPKGWTAPNLSDLVK